MAIKKDLVLNNGITVSYHRVVSVMCVTNSHNSIEVCSYLTQEARESQKTYYRRQLAAKGERSSTAVEEEPPFTYTLHITAPYDQTMTVIDAYEHLKTLNPFLGAEDVLEEPISLF